MLKLLSWKVRIELARYRANRLAIVGPVVVIALAALAFWAARVTFEALVEIAPAFADFLLLVLYASGAMFLTIAGLRWGVQRLFLSSDLELMLALPIPSRHVLTTKALEIVVSSPVAPVTLTAMTWGYLRAHEQPAALALALLAVIPLILGSALPGVLITLVVVRTLARSHVRALLAVVPGLIGATFVFIGPLAGGLTRVIAGRIDAQRLEEIAASGSGALRALPSSWAADIAIGLATDDAGLVVRGAGLAVVAIAALALLAQWAFKATFRTAWTQMAEASARVRRGTFLERLVPPFPSPIRATILKEWRTFFRDMRTVATAFFPAMIFGYFVVSNARQEDGVGWFFPMFFLTLAFPGVASTALLGERRNITIYKAAPIRGIQALLGKLAAYGMPLAILVAVAATTFGVLANRRPVELVLLNVFGLWVLGWVMLTHLAVAGLWARFDAEKPTLPFLPSIAGMLATSSMSATQSLLGLWLAGRVGTDVGFLSHPLLGVPLLAVAGSWCVGAAFAAAAAGRRLDRLDAP